MKEKSQFNKQRLLQRKGSADFLKHQPWTQQMLTKPLNSYLKV